MTNEWELGGYDPTTWTGHAPVIDNIPIKNLVGDSFGILPPEMKPSKVLEIMSESFDDEGDVSTFEDILSKRDDALSASKIYTASGGTIDKNNFNPRRLQTEPLYLRDTSRFDAEEGKVPLSLTERDEITDLVQSGRPNFAGSSNIQGVEVIAIVALVGVES